MNRQSGLLLLPLAIFMSIGLGAAFLLVPSMNREDTIERQRLLKEQARAAAEGALALAVHQGGDVTDLTLGRATADASIATEDDQVVITATGSVPSLRGARVTVTVTRRRDRLLGQSD